MTFANLSPAWVLGGLAALAALLYAIQHLRTRYRDMTIVTTMFWRQVVDEAPVRRLWERFRHPWAYLLILAICSLLWIALAEPQFEETRDDRFYVLILDGSAGMAAGDQFTHAVQLLKTQVARLPSRQRQVLWSGGRIRTLLAPGEHELLLARRLDALKPEAAPATVETLLREVAGARRGPQATSVLVFGDAPVRKQVLDLLPPTISVTRAAASEPVEGNAGITALGVSEAASGAWDKVDVLVRVEGNREASVPVRPSDVRVELDGSALSGTTVQLAGQTPIDGFLIRDLPAKGGLFTARLTRTDALSLDNVASVRLPDRPIVKVLLSPTLGAAIAPALGADRGVELTSQHPDAVIRRRGEPFGGNVPALEFVDASAQPDAFVLTHPKTWDSEAVFAEAVEAIGLKAIDAMSLAQASQRQIGVSIASGAQWKLSVWQELLSKDYNFTQSRAFPLFIANAVRWLAGTHVWFASAAAGRPLTPATTGLAQHIVSADGRIFDTLGADFVPATAGALPVQSGEKPLAISLLDSTVTAGTRESALDVANMHQLHPARQTSALTWILLLAVVLLGTEWYVYQKGGMP